MKVLTLFPFFLAIVSFPLVAQVNEEDIQVEVGIDRVEKLQFKPSSKVEIGNDTVLTYTLIPDDHLREITFKGIKPGKTSVIIRDTNGEIRARYNIQVVANDLSQTVLKLREFFKDVEGIEVKIKGGVVVLEGKLLVPSDITKIQNIISRGEFKDVVTMVELSPQTQQIIARRVQDEIHRAGMKDVTVRVVNSQYWLEGFVTRKGEVDTAKLIANSMLPDQKDNVISFIAENIKTPKPPAPKMVKITAQFVELAKDYKSAFGFKWTPAISGDGGSIQVGKTTDGGITTRSSGTLSATISNLFPKLASAKSSGNARIIQQGMVLVKEGIQAQLNKTTKTPFALGTGDFTRAQEAESGFKLTITPEIQADNNIELKTNLNVSLSTGSPPQTISNLVDTTLVVKSQESAVIGGISFSEFSTAFDKSPPFGADEFENATPLFSFLRSKDYSTAKSQFVIFLTPEVVESASLGTEDIKRKFRKRER